VWAKLDALYILATKDTSNAILNLVSTSYTLTPNGSPTFTVDVGYTGVDSSSTVYLDTNMNPITAGGLHTATSAHLATWTPTDFNTGGGLISIGSRVTALTDIVPRYSNGNSFGRLFGAQITVTLSDSVGMYVLNGDATNVNFYKNGSLIGGPVSTGGSPNNATYWVLGRNPDAGGIGAPVSMASIGGNLTATNVANFYTRMNTYMALLPFGTDVFAGGAISSDSGLVAEGEGGVVTGVGQRTIWWRAN
jgi:hypothetical protein